MKSEALDLWSLSTEGTKEFATAIEMTGESTQTTNRSLSPIRRKLCISPLSFSIRKAAANSSLFTFHFLFDLLQRQFHHLLHRQVGLFLQDLHHHLLCRRGREAQHRQGAHSLLLHHSGSFPS